MAINLNLNRRGAPGSGCQASTFYKEKTLMKILLATIFAGSVLCLPAQDITKKPDFIQKNAAGEIILRGIYTTDDSGYVVRYDLFDADGKLTKTSIPYYSRDGRLLESREYDAAGKLAEVIVFIGDRLVGLTPEGTKIEKYDDQRVDVKGFFDHFQNKK